MHDLRPRQGSRRGCGRHRPSRPCHRFRGMPARGNVVHLLSHTRAADHIAHRHVTPEAVVRKRLERVRGEVAPLSDRDEDAPQPGHESPDAAGLCRSLRSHARLLDMSWTPPARSRGALGAAHNVGLPRQVPCPFLGCPNGLHDRNGRAARHGSTFLCKISKSGNRLVGLPRKIGLRVPPASMRVDSRSPCQPEAGKQSGSATGDWGQDDCEERMYDDGEARGYHADT